MGFLLLCPNLVTMKLFITGIGTDVGQLCNRLKYFCGY